MLTQDITAILRERGVLDDEASIRGISLGDTPATTEELADIIQKALEDIAAGNGRDIDLDF